MSKGKDKGSSFERDLSRSLSLWWSAGARDDIFWRTSQSGGRSKTRMKVGKKTYGQYGDIQAVDPIGAPLMRLLTIEAKKGYNRDDAFSAVDTRYPGESKWEKFVHQAEGDARNAGTPFWMLIHKRDGRAACAFMPKSLYLQLKQKLDGCTPNIHLNLVGGKEIFGTPLLTLLATIGPIDLKSLIARLSTSIPVIKIRKRTQE